MQPRAHELFKGFPSKVLSIGHAALLRFLQLLRHDDDADALPNELPQTTPELLEREASLVTVAVRMHRLILGMVKEDGDGLAPRP